MFMADTYAHMVCVAFSRWHMLTVLPVISCDVIKVTEVTLI